MDQLLQPLNYCGLREIAKLKPNIYVLGFERLVNLRR